MSMITTAPSATTLTMRRSARLQIMRLRRMLDGWVAAAIAYRESRSLSWPSANCRRAS